MKKLPKFEDMEILTAEDLEENGNKKAAKRKWQKIVLGLFVGILIVIAGGSAAFLVFRTNGEKNLKTKVESSSDTSKRREGHYILHNGKEYRYREDVINILCLGIDKELTMDEKKDSGGLGMADAILLVSIDTKADTLKIIAVPRDTMTDVQVVDEAGKKAQKTNMQVCAQYFYGKTAAQGGELMTETISELLYRVPIQRYCAINFQALPVINDAIGGVDVTVLEDLSWYKPEFVYGTELHLNGELAFDYVRQRAEWVEGSAMMRVERQKQYVMAFLEKAKSVVSQDLSIPVTIFQELQGEMSTNLKVEDIAYLAPELVNMTVLVDEIQMIPGEVVFNDPYEEYHADETALKELVINSFYEEVKESEEGTR